MTPTHMPDDFMTDLFDRVENNKRRPLADWQKGEAARKNRDEAMERVEENAEEGFSERARAVIQQVAEAKEDFTSDDVWPILGKNSTHNRKAIGPPFNSLVRAGVIEKTGEWRPSTDPECNGRDKPVYRKVGKLASVNARVLVCGGREYRDYAKVRETLNAVKPRILVHGGATGADKCCGLYAEEKGVPCMVIPAPWKKHGKAAGPIRNGWMLQLTKPTLVLAFPGGAGTSDMVKQALDAGIPVRSIAP